MDIEIVKSFADSFSLDKQLTESIQGINKSVTALLKLTDNGLKEKKRRRNDEKARKKKEKRDEKRREADLAREDRKIEKRIKKAEKKEDSFDKLLKWGAIGLGVAGVGGLAYIFRDEIKEAIDDIVQNIKDEIGKELKKIQEDLTKWATDAVAQFGKDLASFVASPIQTVAEGLQIQTGGVGTTESGLQFGYDDVVYLLESRKHSSVIMVSLVSLPMRN